MANAGAAREGLKQKKRIVVKIGSSSLTHENGRLHLQRMEKLVRVLCELKNRGMDVILVSSGAGAVGRTTMKLAEKPSALPEKQALAAIGQARLMMIYERLFSEYGRTTAQILLTKSAILSEESRRSAQATFETLLSMHVIPVVNENDTVETHEFRFGDNDRLSAIVVALTGADLLVLLSDIDGLYTDDPTRSDTAEKIALVPDLTEEILRMGKESPGSSFGTGGMASKLEAARIACHCGADMVIASGEDPEILYRILQGEEEGTLFLHQPDSDFDMYAYLNETE